MLQFVASRGALIQISAINFISLLLILYFDEDLSVCVKSFGRRPCGTLEFLMPFLCAQYVQKIFLKIVYLVKKMSYAKMGLFFEKRSITSHKTKK